MQCMLPSVTLRSLNKFLFVERKYTIYFVAAECIARMLYHFAATLITNDDHSFLSEL